MLANTWTSFHRPPDSLIKKILQRFVNYRNAVRIPKPVDPRRAIIAIAMLALMDTERV